jgi:hypothetical protein
MQTRNVKFEKRTLLYDLTTAGCALSSNAGGVVGGVSVNEEGETPSPLSCDFRARCTSPPMSLAPTRGGMWRRSIGFMNNENNVRTHTAAHIPVTNQAGRGRKYAVALILPQCVQVLMILCSL